jgi:hypothetical protein
MGYAGWGYPDQIPDILFAAMGGEMWRILSVVSLICLTHYSYKPKLFQFSKQLS